MQLFLPPHTPSKRAPPHNRRPRTQPDTQTRLTYHPAVPGFRIWPRMASTQTGDRILLTHHCLPTMRNYSTTPKPQACSHCLTPPPPNSVQRASVIACSSPPLPPLVVTKFGTHAPLSLTGLATERACVCVLTACCQPPQPAFIPPARPRVSSLPPV